MFYNLHTHKSSDTNHIEIINLQYDCNPDFNKHYSFGIHPWDITTINIATAIERLKQLIAGKKIISIGEIGIDRAIETPVQLQYDVFQGQHQIAESAGMPIIIHCVKAYADFLQIHQQLKPAIPWIFHGFTGNPKLAKQLTGKQCYLSFGERLLNHSKTQEALTQIPVQNFFFETDTSQTPIETIYTKASELLQIDMEKLTNIVSENFKTVFQF